MIHHRLDLDYALSPGWLAPWVEGVLDGRAVGRKCMACDRISFAPLRVCDCGGDDGAWTELPGTATILRRTDGLDGAFGLVRFDSADTATVVRLTGFEPDQTRGRLRRSETGLPAMILQPCSTGAMP